MGQMKFSITPRCGVIELAVTVVHILLWLQFIELDNMHYLLKVIFGLDFIAFTLEQMLPKDEIHFMVVLKTNKQTPQKNFSNSRATLSLRAQIPFKWCG